MNDWYFLVRESGRGHILPWREFSFDHTGGRRTPNMNWPLSVHKSLRHLNRQKP